LWGKNTFSVKKEDWNKKLMNGSLTWKNFAFFRVAKKVATTKRNFFTQKDEFFSNLKLKSRVRFISGI
jgi:hypothetical protein